MTCRRLVGLPDVQVQAVLSHTIFGSGIARRLDGGFPIVICLVDTVVRSNVHRCFPAQVSNGLFSHKGDALVGNDSVRLPADKSAVYAPDGSALS